MQVECLFQHLRIQYEFCIRNESIDDFNNRNIFLIAKLLKQGYRYLKIRKSFSKFYHRHSGLIVICSIEIKLFCDRAYHYLYFMVIWFINSTELLKTLILVINSKKIIKRYEKVGYNLDIMRQSALLIYNPITDL